MGINVGLRFVVKEVRICENYQVATKGIPPPIMEKIVSEIPNKFRGNPAPEIRL